MIGPRPMPASLGRYNVRAKVADGGMAAIYLGRLRGAAPLEGAVALKVIKDEYALNMEFVHMFVDEAKIASRLRHPHIVKIQDFSADGDRLFLAMDFLMGQSLWNVWQACKNREVRLRYDMIAWICARVCEALHYAHELKDENGNALELVHRDVNATNIFVEYDGGIKVIDFGLAKAIGRVSKTAAGVIKGKLAYMSPEQVVGSGVDRRADIFALGATLWELSVDRRLFKVKEDIETLKAVHEAKVPDPTTLVHGYPPLLWKVLKRALVRDRDARYATAKEMGIALDAFVASEGRIVTPSDVAEAMNSLFEFERERQLAWVMEASDPRRAAPTYTLNPAPDKMDFGGMGSKVEPRPGTFESADPNAQATSGAARDARARDLKSPVIPAAPAVPDFSGKAKRPPVGAPAVEKKKEVAVEEKKRSAVTTLEEKSAVTKGARGTNFVAVALGILLALACVAAGAAAIMKK